MSTTFKIIENHIENTKTSPKKSVALASSHLSPTSNAFDSEDEIDQFDKQQVLKLEIKQLQRENKFLKKKIVQLTAQLNGDSQPKKKVVSGKGAPKQDLDPIHLTVEFFFGQINNLMNSVADLFKVQFTNEQVKQFSSRFVPEEKTNPQQKYALFKKIALVRKLQKITLQPDEKRYSSLLDVFTTYYKAKEECDRFIRQTVDGLSSKVLQLNKMILNNASRKRNSLKGSSVKSQYVYQQYQDKNILGLPWSLKQPIPLQNLCLTQQKQREKSKTSTRKQ